MHHGGDAAGFPRYIHCDLMTAHEETDLLFYQNPSEHPALKPPRFTDFQQRVIATGKFPKC